MSANGRFTPPRDKKNKPIASQWSSSVRWKLETPLGIADVAAGCSRRCRDTDFDWTL